MAKYYSGEPVLAEYKAVPNCTLYCPKCDQAIQNGQQAVGRDVHKCGEYDYTEIVHAECYTGPEPVVFTEVKPEPVNAGTAYPSILIDGKTVEQWLAGRGK